MRVARSTDHLAEITRMYVEGLGFALIGEFHGHNGFDGSIIGHPEHPYHLEFTHHHGAKVGTAPTKDNLLVFYIPDKRIWAECCGKMKAAGFRLVPAYNDYWEFTGQSFEDIDGYRVVLQNRAWSA